jgi:Holliday junction resolvase RusA-like endonuclease
MDKVPVSVNSAYKRAKLSSGKQGMYMTKNAKKYKEELAWMAKEVVKNNKWKLFDEERFFFVDLYYTFKSKRFVDPNNTHKITLDALEGIVFDNDKWALTRDMGAKFGKREHFTIVIRIPENTYKEVIADVY